MLLVIDLTLIWKRDVFFKTEILTILEEITGILVNRVTLKEIIIGLVKMFLLDLNIDKQSFSYFCKVFALLKNNKFVLNKTFENI